MFDQSQACHVRIPYSLTCQVDQSPWLVNGDGDLEHEGQATR